jgi:membrane associated rhomboid family serine protease
MRSLFKKFRYIILPYIFLLVLCCGVYTYLHWLLIIKLEVFELKQEVTEFFIPAGLTALLTFTFLRSRIRRLRLKNNGRADIPSLYAFVALAGIAIPCGIAQAYMIKATGKLMALENVDAIAKTEKARYYTLKEHFMYKNAYNVTVEFSVHGKHNEDLRISIYYVTPILAKADDSASHECRAWYGMEYSETISNRDDDDVKQKKYEAFYDESWDKFLASDLDSFTYLERTPPSDDRDGYLKAIKEQKVFSSTDPVILSPVYEPFEARIGEKPKWFWLSLLIGFGVFTLMVLIPRLKEEEQFDHEQKRMQRESRETFRGILPHKGSIVTPLVAYALILIYAGMALSGMGVISFKSEDLINIGGNYGPKTLNGEWWRLVTSTFLHGGLMHIINNLVGLVLAGVFLESILGSGRFGIAYIVSGICASLASVWWDPTRVSIGASGAIFGLEGVLLALTLFKAYPKVMNKAVLVGTLIYVGYNLVIGAAMPGVDNSAHVGGLVSGFIIGLFFVPVMRRRIADMEALEEAGAATQDLGSDEGTTYTDQQ